MEFRWAMLIALWTLLAGPAFDSSGPSGVQRRQQPSISASPARSRVERSYPNVGRVIAATAKKEKPAP